MTLALVSAICVAGFTGLAFRFKAAGVRYSFLGFCLALIVYLTCGHFVETGRGSETVFRLLYFAAMPAVGSLTVFTAFLSPRRRSRILAGAGLPALVFVGLLIAGTDAVIAGAHLNRAVFGPWGFLFVVAVGGGLLLNVVALTLSWYNETGLVRFQLAGTLLAMIIASTLTVSTNVVAPVLFAYSELSGVGSPLAAILWVAILAATILVAQRRAKQQDPRRDVVTIPNGQYLGLLESLQELRQENIRLQAEAEKLNLMLLSTETETAMEQATTKDDMIRMLLYIRERHGGEFLDRLMTELADRFPDQSV